LDPGINRDYWTAEEDANLTKAVDKLGTQWPAVAALIPERSCMQCKNRWVKYLDHTVAHHSGKWTEEDDAKLTEAVTKLGARDWIAVAALVPGRTNMQCRNK
jgi:hypothetical protein